MATMNQLMTALRSADAAGATDDAQRIAQIIASQQRSGPRDSAFGYSIDWAQQMFGKGVEVIGDLVGSNIFTFCQHWEMFAHTGKAD